MSTIHLPTAQFANVLSLTARRIRQLVDIGVLPKPVKAGHDLFVAVPKYLAYLSRPSESTTLSEARKKKVEIETKIKTLELRRREGEVVERAAVEKAQYAAGRRIKDGCSNLPSRVSGILAAESDRAKIHLILTKEIHQILEELSDEPDPTKPH